MAGAAAVAHHARPRLPLAHQSRKGSPVAREEERRNTISQADLLREADCVSSSSDSNSRTTQLQHEAAAAKQSSGSNNSSIAHQARPRPISAQQSRKGSTVGHDEGR